MQPNNYNSHLAFNCVLLYPGQVVWESSQFAGLATQGGSACLLSPNVERVESRELVEHENVFID